MKIVKTVNDVRKIRKGIAGSIGFIPTMGYLHEGHISLVKRAKKENDFVIVSIFVNPKQFGPSEDLSKYPRDAKRDISLLESAGADGVFLPNTDEIYPIGFETYVSVTALSKVLEGEKRPGHFDGVCTVVAKLFNIIQPQTVYFGQKDAQQIAVIKKMVTDLQIPVIVKTGETIRENDGLAMSSRNIFLSQQERKEAVSLYHSLQLAERLYKDGQRNSEKIKHEMAKIINQANGKIDYISIADPTTLEELSEIKADVLVSIAVYMGKTRLIDNLLLHSKKKG